MEISSPLMCLLIVGIFSSTEASCSVRIDSPNARAKHTVLGTDPYPTYSCTSCDKGNFEVHAINMHKAYGPPSRFEKPPKTLAAVPITLEAAGPTSIKLVLTSYEATHWRITKDWQTTILDIALVSSYGQYCNVTGYWGAPIPFTSYHISYHSGISNWDSLQNIFVSFAKSHLGILTSYTGVYRTSAWLLNVGSCTPDDDVSIVTPPMSTVTPPFRMQTSVGACVKSTNNPSASAIETILEPNSYDTYSCVPCFKTNHEVHVLGIYEPYETWRGFREEPKNIVTVPVTIRAEGPIDIDLVLNSHEAVHWLIGKPSTVTIVELGLVSYYINHTTVEIDGTQSTPIIKRYREYLKFDEVQPFIESNFGFLSSYTEVYGTSAWTLTVGECSNSSVNTTASRGGEPTTPAFPTTPRIAVIGGTTGGIVVLMIVALMIFIYMKTRSKAGVENDREMAPRPPTTAYELPDVTDHVYEEIDEPYVQTTPDDGQYEKLRKDVQTTYNKWLMDNDIDRMTKEKLQQHGVRNIADVKKLSHPDMIEIGLNVGERNRLRDAILTIPKKY